MTWIFLLFVSLYVIKRIKNFNHVSDIYIYIFCSHFKLWLFYIKKNKQKETFERRIYIQHKDSTLYEQAKIRSYDCQEMKKIKNKKRGGKLTAYNVYYT